MDHASTETSRQPILFIFTVDVERDVPHRVDSDLGIIQLDPLLELLSHFGIIGTFFITGDIARSFPERLDQIRALGHEIGCHGWEHEPYNSNHPCGLSFPPLTEEKRRDYLSKATELLANLCSEQPVSFRAPYLSFAPETLEVLAELGYQADCSQWTRAGSATDIRPYSIVCSHQREIIEVPVPSASIQHDHPPYINQPGLCTFSLRMAGKQSVREATRMVVEHQTGSEPVVVVFSCHPWEFVACPPWQGKLPPHFWFRTAQLLEDLQDYLEFIHTEYSPTFISIKHIASLLRKRPQLYTEEQNA